MGLSAENLAGCAGGAAETPVSWGTFADRQQDGEGLPGRGRHGRKAEHACTDKGEIKSFRTEKRQNTEGLESAKPGPQGTLSFPQIPARQTASEGQTGSDGGGEGRAWPPGGAPRWVRS